MMLLILLLSLSNAQAALKKAAAPAPQVQIKSVCDWPISGLSADRIAKIKALQKAAKCPEKK